MSVSDIGSRNTSQAGEIDHLIDTGKIGHDRGLYQYRYVWKDSYFDTYTFQLWVFMIFEALTKVLSLKIC